MFDGTAPALDTATALRLELKFEFVVLAQRGPEVPSYAGLSECLFLVRRIERVIRAYEASSKFDSSALSRILAGKIDDLEALDFSGPTKAPLKKLHFGSPFIFEILLTPVTVSGLAMLLYGIKRLYGFPLELRAYREFRRAEYIEAKAMAEALEKYGPHSIESRLKTPPGVDPWELKRGVIAEEEVRPDEAR